jgi:ABC-2 type transport system ATP-binding protein
MNTVNVENATKIFVKRKGLLRRVVKESKVVDSISFKIAPSELMSLLGPNGAGKTTTIKMLSTLLLPTSGRLEVCGYDTVKEEKKVRSNIGTVLPGERSLFWKLTVKENLEYFGALAGVRSKALGDRIKLLLKQFHIEDKCNEFVERLSTGMKQKVILCRALLSEPKVLLLDEPTLGLDPISAQELRTMIKTIKANGTIILLTTHYMREAEELSDKVAIMKSGKIIAFDKPSVLSKQFNGKSMVSLVLANESMGKLAFIETLFDGQAKVVSKTDYRTTLTIENGKNINNFRELLPTLLNEKINIYSFDSHVPSLEDVYISLIQDSLEPSAYMDSVE